MRKINKKGEMTTQQIVTLIILIASFVVILIFLFILNLGETSNKEICHNSVVLKSKGGGFVGRLDCSTNYLCISGGGECEDFTPTSTVKIDPSSKEEIMDAIVAEMADCWWMFGEGELDYMQGIFELKTACAVCSIIKFDDEIQQKFETITYREFLDNLDKPMNEKETYLHYFFDVFSTEDLPNNFPFIKEYYDSRSISLGDKYLIRTGESKTVIFGVTIHQNNFPPYLFKVGETQEPHCDEFITKA